MNLRFCALLCVTGLAACSHTPSETARDPSYDSQQASYGNQQARSSTEPVSTQPAANDPALKPASLESTAAPGSKTPSSKTPPPKMQTPPPNAQTPPPAVENGSDARAPLPADKPATAPADVAADNTKKNERDRNSAALTPMDQNNNQADLKITQQIRQAVMADSSLSFTAKNVKIITQNGRVTLRGPVKSDKERSAIEAAARRVAGAVEVDNQIEVKK